jgi:quercetin dioxygenase-like cupin family protein
MKKVLTVGGILVLTLGAWSVGRAAGKEEFKFWSVSELTFKSIAPGAENAVLWGDPHKGHYGLLARFRAGAERGWHTHSNPFHVVIISGTLVFELQEGGSHELTAGMGGDEAANVEHNTRCKEGAECLFLVTGDKEFDVKEVKPPANTVTSLTARRTTSLPASSGA